MGMLDSEIQLSIAQAATDHTTDTPSTNVYDFGQTNASAGLTGENLWLQVIVNTAVTSAGSATVQAVLQDSADNSTFADVVAGPAVAKASCTAGASLLQLQLPVGLRRYMRVAYRIGVADLTAGKFDAYVSNTLERNQAQASGFSVS